jgi:hypothetical protein
MPAARGIRLKRALYFVFKLRSKKKGKSDNGNQLYLHYKYDSSNLSFSKLILIIAGCLAAKNSTNSLVRVVGAALSPFYLIFYILYFIFNI